MSRAFLRRRVAGDRDVSRRRAGRGGAAVTAGVAALVVAAACAGWAFTVILSPAPGVPSADGYTLVTAIEGDVESHLTLNAAATWNVSPVGTNEASGVVTTVDAQPGQLVSNGDRLYSVDARAVVAAQGSVPAYRSIAPGDSGNDVAQLQAMLGALGLYAGPVDGTAGSSTVDAIIHWQRSLGIEATGEVRFGDVVFVPSLPARLELKADVVHRGATLAGGEAAVLWLGEAPVFTLPVSEAQSQQVPTGTRVVIDDGAGDSWNAVATGRSETDTGTVVIALQAGAGAGAGAGAAGIPDTPICGAHCDIVPVDGQTLFVSRVVTVEPVHGVVVPSASVQTDAAERLMLVDGGGVDHPVSVVAEAAGQSVVTGIDAGLAVRVPSGAVGAGSGVGAGGATAPDPEATR